MRKRILLIEDNRITRKILRIAFEAKGYELLEAEDGRTALQIASNGPLDLIIQDLVLPDVDADFLVRRIRSLPDCDNIPILAFSAFTTQLDAARSLDSAFAGFVQKPVEPSRLLTVVENTLTGRRTGSASSGA